MTDEKTIAILDFMTTQIRTNEFKTIYLPDNFPYTEQEIKAALHQALSELYKKKQNGIDK